jgi:3-oxoacyl-[acyl-carrier-protein] synthase-3
VKRIRPAAFDAVITGTGSYMPERVLGNDELSSMVDTSNEWILSRTGIRERRIARPDEACSDLGAEAAKRALDYAGVAAADVDMIIVATITPDMGFPNTGCFIQRKIGATKAFCMDLEAACSGFIYALEVASQFVSTGAVKTALVIGSEKISSITDWTDRSLCILFGDGAGAAVVQGRPAGSGGVIHTILRSDGRLAELLKLPGGGSRHPTSIQTIEQRLHYMKMDGKEVFKHAVTCMTSVAKDVIAACGLTIEDIKLIIPHQANMRIVQAIGERLGERSDQYFINLDKYGNTSAASVVVALDEAARSGRLKKGDLALLVAFGGGFTWGATIVEWNHD